MLRHLYSFWKLIHSPLFSVFWFVCLFLRIHPRWSGSVSTYCFLTPTPHFIDLGPDLPKPSCLQGIFCIYFVADCFWWDLIPSASCLSEIIPKLYCWFLNSFISLQHQGFILFHFFLFFLFFCLFVGNRIKMMVDLWTQSLIIIQF